MDDAVECAQRGLAYALMTLERLKAMLDELEELEQILRREIARLEKVTERRKKIRVEG